MSKKNILVVEDEKITAKSIKEILERLNYNVVDCIETGEDAVRVVNNEKVDLILMDIMLDGEIDGIDTANMIHKNFDIPVIYISSHSDDQTIKKAKISSPYSFIVKPIRGREIEIVTEIAFERVEMERKQKKLIQELRKALDDIKVLNGLIPI